MVWLCILCIFKVQGTCRVVHTAATACRVRIRGVRVLQYDEGVHAFKIRSSSKCSRALPYCSARSYNACINAGRIAYVSYLSCCGQLVAGASFRRTKRALPSWMMLRSGITAASNHFLSAPLLPQLVNVVMRSKTSTTISFLWITPSKTSPLTSTTEIPSSRLRVTLHMLRANQSQRRYVGFIGR